MDFSLRVMSLAIPQGKFVRKAGDMDILGGGEDWGKDSSNSCKERPLVPRQQID